MNRYIKWLIALCVLFAYPVWGATETSKPAAISDDWGGALNTNSTTFGGSWLTGPDSTTNPFSIGRSGSYHYVYSVRFPSIDIPQGATIDSAELWVRAHTSTCTGTECDTAHVRIRAAIYDADNGIQITDTAGFRSTWASRATSNGSIDTANLQSTDWNGGTYYRMPYNQLDSVIQVAISRAGWVSGNSITLMFATTADCPDSTRRIRNYDYGVDGTSYDSLWISYTAGGGGSPSATPNVVIRSATIRNAIVRCPPKLYRREETWKW